MFQKFIPESFPLKDKVFQVICDCQVNRDHVKDKKISEAQFGGFLVECLKGTSSEKADILCLFCDQVGAEVADYKLYQVSQRFKCALNFQACKSNNMKALNLLVIFTFIIVYF